MSGAIIRVSSADHLLFFSVDFLPLSMDFFHTKRFFGVVFYATDLCLLDDRGIYVNMRLYYCSNVAITAKGIPV